MRKLGPDILTLLIGQIPADFADWMDFVAIGALLAFVWQVDTIVFALLAVCMGLPYLIFGPLAGALVDRSNTRTILIASNIGRALATASFFFAPSWPVLLALIALRSTVDTFYTPANQAAIRKLTDTALRPQTNAISYGINQASKIVAPSLGGMVLIWMTPHFVFAMNAAVSLLAAALLMRLPQMARAATQDQTKDSILTTLRRAVALLSGTPILRAAIGMMAAGYFAMFFYDTLIAPLTRDLGFSQTHLGLSLAAVGAGGVIAAAAMARWATLSRPFVFVAIGGAIGGTAVTTIGAVEVLGLPITLPVFLGAFFVLGVTSAMSVVPFRTVLQNNTDDTSIGQITALSEAANTIALLTAPFIGAGLAAWSSIGAAFVLGGLVLLGIAWRAWGLRDAA